MSALVESIRLFGPAFAASLLVALACSLTGVHIVARRLVTVGVALPQAAALGIALSFVALGDAGAHAPWEHDAFALAVEGGAVALLALGGRGRSLGSDALAGVVFVGAGALTILLMMRTAAGLDEVRNLAEGNILAVHRPELVRIGAVLAPVIALHVLGARRLMACTFDRETAATLGVRTGLWEFLFFAALALAVAVGVHATGTLFVFAFLVLPGAAGVALGRSAGGVLGTAAAVGVGGAGAGFVLSYAWDTPTGPTCAATALALFVVCVAAAWGRAAREG